MIGTHCSQIFSKCCHILHILRSNSFQTAATHKSMLKRTFRRKREIQWRNFIFRLHAVTLTVRHDILCDYDWWGLTVVRNRVPSHRLRFCRPCHTWRTQSCRPVTVPYLAGCIHRHLEFRLLVGSSLTPYGTCHLFMKKKIYVYINVNIQEKRKLVQIHNILHNFVCVHVYTINFPGHPVCPYKCTDSEMQG